MSARTMTLPKLPMTGNTWTGTEMIHPPSPPRPVPNYPGWVSINCGCCDGMEWGREGPTECSDCDGGGQSFVHLATGTGACWPGGPFNGWKFDLDDCARYA